MIELEMEPRAMPKQVRDRSPLRDFIDMTGLKVSAAARLADVSEATMKQWASGRRVPPDDIQDRIRAALLSRLLPNPGCVPYEVGSASNFAEEVMHLLWDVIEIDRAVMGIFQDALFDLSPEAKLKLAGWLVAQAKDELQE